MNASSPRRLRRSERGNTLLISMVLFVVLAILVVGSISLSGVEVGAANAKLDYDNLTACARGGRELLLSQFKLSSAQPTKIDVLMPGPGNDLRIASGHYGDVLPADGAGAGLTFKLRPLNQAGTDTGAEDISNKIMGGAATNPSTYTVVCEDRRGKRYELEFTLRFGF